MCFHKQIDTTLGSQFPAESTRQVKNTWRRFASTQSCLVTDTDRNRVCEIIKFMYIRLKHGIGADQDYFMLYHWYRKNKNDMTKFNKLIRLTVTHLTLLKISRC